ncbi:hypothetical protein [Methylomonas sp. MgM2]
MAIKVKLFQHFLACLLLSFNASAAFVANDSCGESGETHIWISPRNPAIDSVVKIMAVSTDGPLSELSLTDRDGRHENLKFKRLGGPPWSLVAELAGLSKGVYSISAGRDGQRTACHRLVVGGSNAPESPMTWGLATEAFYSAWIEALFDAPPKQNLSFPSLEPVLRNAQRNFLYNHLGFNEDKNLPLSPDCADLPYILRAYFAWKVGLPIAFRNCGRGSAKAAPRCGAATVKSEFVRRSRPQSTFREIYNQLVNAVHSGSARTGLEDESSDMYPVALSRETLWPGTVYADPYGHVLVLVKWLPQSEDRPGMLLVADAQPDNTVARKRVWQGTLLFAQVKNAGPGFKAFRPLVRNPANGWRLLTNEELTDHPGFFPFSLAQQKLSPDDFYAKLAKLVNPSGLDPIQAYEATLDALLEQLQTRVNSVSNGEAYVRKNPGKVIPMPGGGAIFQTVGPWEDYSTPARDMRLLIAIKVLNDFPQSIVRHPELFVMPGKNPEQAAAEVLRAHAGYIRDRSIDYTRSDGSTWELSVAEVLARKPAFEMAYNPNDCPEIRWGAKPGTKEYASCRRHAPAEQRAKMERYRAWFRETRRPLP